MIMSMQEYKVYGYLTCTGVRVVVVLDDADTKVVTLDKGIRFIDISNSQPSTLNPQPSTLNPQPDTQPTDPSVSQSREK